MWLYRKTDPYRLFSRSRFVTTVGGGGKTTLGEYLAARASGEGKRAAVTTTTRISARESYTLFDDIRKNKSCPAGCREGFVRIGKGVEGGKLTSLSFDEVAWLGKSFDFVVIEADGAKGKPLKYPSATEPVVPPFSDCTIAVAGLDGLGEGVADKVFRWELLRDATGVAGETIIDPALFVRLFEARGMMKDVEPGKGTIFLNKYEICREREKVFPLAQELIAHTGVPRVIVSSLFLNLFYSVDRV